MRIRTSLATIVSLVLLTALAIATHGYHIGAEDQEVYLAAIKKDLNPALYPHNSAFFMLQMKATLFDTLMAFCTRLSHLPVSYVLFFWHALSIFLLLYGCWKIACHCFARATARWAGVVTIAALLTLPVAGTALYIVDQYLHPRALASAAILLAISALLERRYLFVMLWLAAATAMHPLMAAFGISYVVFMLLRRPKVSWVGLAAAMPLVPVVSPQWKQAVLARDYYFLSRWTWYEWLGILAPLGLAYYFLILARRRNLPVLAYLCDTLLWFGGFQFAVALVLALPVFEGLTAFQPMRWMHLYYILFFLFAGCLAGEFILHKRPLAWAIFVPLFCAMFLVQRQLFPASPHIEIRETPKNDWVSAFDWIRKNTPTDAYFAVNPEYMSLKGEDNHGFRALAERSMLAEDAKDPGAASVFPALLGPWFGQTQALRGWKQFTGEDFTRLHYQFGVDWVIVEHNICCLPCPYQNRSVRVCQIPPVAIATGQK